MASDPKTNHPLIPMTVSELNKHIIATLSPVLGGGEARSAARIIWDDVLHYTPAQIVIRGDHQLESFTVENIEQLLRRVCEGEPLQYAIGSARFMGMDLKVTPATLIPRPETAGLVDLITDRFGQLPDLRVLDVGTGSGCIALALSRALRFAHIYAMDISQPALDVARGNARNLDCRINFVHADALQLPTGGPNEVRTPPEGYDIIVSNPPYVLDSEATEMEARVLDHEPKTALFVPDSDPLKFYRPISEYARKALRPGGMLFFEINPMEAAAMSKLLHSLGFDNVEIHNDYLGRKRFVTAAV